jgi:DNA-directed RNA polymerase specialized sigma24 family protein
MSEREYARLTGVSQPSVNQRKTRILGKLKKLLEN